MKVFNKRHSEVRLMELDAATLFLEVLSSAGLGFVWRIHIAKNIRYAAGVGGLVSVIAFFFSLLPSAASRSYQFSQLFTEKFPLLIIGLIISSASAGISGSVASFFREHN